VGSTHAQRVAVWHKILADLQQHEATVTFADLQGHSTSHSVLW
jgi:hypothetical protein